MLKTQPAVLREVKQTCLVNAWSTLYSEIVLYVLCIYILAVLWGGFLCRSLMLPGTSRCTRSISACLSLARPLAHVPPHMDPDPNRLVERTIRTKLANVFKPDHLEVHNESHMHAVPPGSESHFRVLVVSSQFQGLPLIQRHRLVNEALKEELRSCVHALAIQAKTPDQWGSDPTLGKSPSCMGGSRGDHTVEEKLKAGRE